MIDLLKNLGIVSEINNLEQSLKANKNCSIFGLNYGEKTWLFKDLDKKLIMISCSNEQIDKYATQFESFGKNISTFSYPKIDPTFNVLQDRDNKYKLLSILTDICTNKLDCLIATPELLIKKLPTKKVFEKHIIHIKLGQECQLQELSHCLLESGYKRVDVIDKKGEYSLKGDVFTIFAVNSEYLIRVEFFDTQIEKITWLNPENYAKIKTVDDVIIAPSTLILDIDKERVLNKLQEEMLAHQDKLTIEATNKQKSIYEQVEHKIFTDDFVCVENYILPFIDNNSYITDYFDNCLIAFDEAKQCYEAINNCYFNLDNTIKNLKDGGELLPVHSNVLPSRQNLPFMNTQMVAFQIITTSNRLFQPDAVYSFQCEAVTSYLSNLDLLKDSIKYYDNKYYTVLVFADSDSRAVEISNKLKTNGVDCQIVNTLSSIKKEMVNIITQKIAYGFCLPKEKLLVVGFMDLLGKKAMLTPKKTNKTTSPFFSLPKVGDYVVHETHGIGKCLGVQKLKFQDYEKEVIVLEYDKGDRLFLPTEQLGLITSYVSDGKAPKLNKLGSQEFEKTKERVKNAIKDMAFDLVELYAKRQKTNGFVYQDEGSVCGEFASTFAFEETEDQKKAIDDTLADMMSGKVMDRLICGDVGYGKTEVALRAIFLAVLNGKQVAFLAPTTILSEQHYNTCMARLSQFGIKVAVVNRFRKPSEIKQIINDLKEGKIDVICGTHRLLSSDVIFRDLGLLVLDEEQRFGVQDKEKIKMLKKNVDVLTLSATPIPRTLHMSLVGIRDISVIETAPTNRLPVQTSVTSFSDGLIKDAIWRELNRDGQVLIVYNRVENIYQFAKKIREIIDNDDVIVSVAHGQMAEKELETEIMNLYNGHTNVLVATTLIENGVDLPSANTLIVMNADTLGLSQLYQLRGRVGRGGVLAYAYFLYDNQKVLSENAYKRLDTIMEYTELGSGFKIAMRDLEIRGCGNVMGKEQHGHMEKVGYDMYCKLLNQAVLEIKGKKHLEESGNIKLDIALNALVPDAFVKNADDRMAIYNKMLEIDTIQKQLDILEEVSNIYGSIPQEVKNFSLVSFARNLATKMGVVLLRINKQSFFIKLDIGKKIEEDIFHDICKRLGIKYTISYTENVLIEFENMFSVDKNLTKIIQIMLEYLSELDKSQKK